MNKILVPLDFSDASKKALNYALSLTKALNSEVIMLHVGTIPTRSGTKLIHKMREVQKEEDKDQITTKVNGFIGDLSDKTGLNHETIIRYGDPSKQIANVSIQEDIDLVIMGTKGSSWIKEKFLGSITISTLKLLSIPIVLVPMAYNEGVVDKKACVALKFDKLYSEQCNKLLKLSTMMGYSAEMMTVVDHKSPDLGISLVKGQRAFPVTIVENQKPRQGISDFLSKNNYGLLALHLNAYSFFKELTYQSVTHEFTFRSKIPILFIR